MVRFPWKPVAAICASVACLCLPARGDHFLPGAANTGASTTGDGRTGLHQVARDSNGYWYVVWENATQTDIVMAYTTTSTPSATTHWGLVTLVDNGGSGRIAAAPANNQSGTAPSIAINRSDHLYLIWKSTSDTRIYSTWCSSLSALTTTTNWATPLKAATDINGTPSFVMDVYGVPHLAGQASGNSKVYYTKYSTSSATWLDVKDMTTGIGLPYGGVSMAAGQDGDVYLATTDGADGYLTASLNASSADVNPTASSWTNLSLTATTSQVIDGVASTIFGTEICVDRNGVVHAAWLADDGTGGVWHQNGILGLGVNPSGPSEVVSSRYSYAGGRVEDDPFPNWHYNNPEYFSWKKDLAWMTAGNGDAYLYITAYNPYRGAVPDAASQTGNDDVYYARIAGSADAFLGYGDISTITAAQHSEYSTIRYVLQPQALPAHRGTILGFAYDTTNAKIKAMDSVIHSGGDSGWIPLYEFPQHPSVAHPHLSWVFPKTAVNLAGTLTVPIVSHGSKSAIYVAENGGASARLYAVDRTTGLYARAVTHGGPVTRISAATYSGNVHLFLEYSSAYLAAYIDNGTSISLDPAWANNPRRLGTANQSMVHSLAFYMEGTTRYLYALADRDPVNIGIWKYYADSGNVVAGYPQGISYAPNSAESVLRILNDNVYVAGNTSQVYRRDSTGGAEIMSSAVVNAVRRLFLVRTNNDLFVTPAGNRVYRLTSDLLTSTWTSGRSADMRPLTSGGQFNPSKSFIFVGAGNQLYKVNVTDGSILSNTPMNATGNIVTLPYQWKSYVYFGTDTGWLFAVNATTPTTYRANWPIGLFPTSSDTDVLSWVVIDSVTNTLYAVARDRTRIFRFSLE